MFRDRGGAMLLSKGRRTACQRRKSDTRRIFLLQGELWCLGEGFHEREQRGSILLALGPLVTTHP